MRGRKKDVDALDKHGQDTGEKIQTDSGVGITHESVAKIEVAPTVEVGRLSE